MKIKNESQLLEILKIFAEESVVKAKKSLKESSDPVQSRYVKELESAERKFGVSLTEEENAEETAEDETEKEDNTKPEAEAEAEEDKATSDAEVFGTSFDSVVKSINTLRAGRSTKDKEIKSELLGYYDRLTDDERQILHLFLKELSKILQGAIQGSEAIDPSDSPLFAKIVLQNQEDEKQGEPEKADSGQDADPTPGGEETGEEEGEDTSPPIKVGGQQNLQEIRKKVKRLMKRL